MAVKYKYPSKPNSVEEKDWNSLHRDETDPVVVAPTPETEDSTATLELPPKDPSIAAGFQRFIDFVRVQAKDFDENKKDPEFQKKMKALKTYKKVKSAS